MRVLLVDDSRTMRNIQRSVLKQIGHEDVVEANDGVQALAELARQRPDLMLLDWNMPNMDGITVVHKVRETDKTLPIIMCTTEAEKSRVIEAIKAGVNNFVVKPFTAESLGAKINETIARIK
ncbi:MAG: response regulator [Planctomycetes bacterium]|nr:response regulator [Planctomycetota bacterium]